MHMEWSEEKFLKGIVGDKRRLSFWNKHQQIELLFMQLTRYNSMHERVLKYQKTIPENLANKYNLSRHKFDIKCVLSACIYSSLAAWAKDLSCEVCFRSIAWFGDPHYLSRTSPHSIQCAWNSRIWNFEFRKTLLPLRNLWIFAPCMRFRPVFLNSRVSTLGQHGCWGWEEQVRFREKREIGSRHFKSASFVDCRAHCWAAGDYAL